MGASVPMNDRRHATGSNELQFLESAAFVVSPDGELLTANESCWALLKEWSIDVGDTVPQSTLLLARRALDTRSAQNEYLDVGPMSIQLVAIPADDGATVTFAGVDATHQRNLNRDLAIKSLMFGHSSEAIVISDESYRTIDVNPAFLELSGYRAEDVLGEQPEWLLRDSTAESLVGEMEERLGEAGIWQGRMWHRRADGRKFAFDLTISRVSAGLEGRLYYVSILHDVTTHLEASERLTQLAHIDTVTQLPNRHAFTQSARKAITSTRRTLERFAIMLVDLDGFKTVNDSHGHAIGDEVLRVTAGRMASVVRDTDTVARLGGDEFGLLVRDIGVPSDAAVVARKLLEAITQPVALESDELVVSGSVGIALFPNDHTDLDHLLRQADNAMYRVKHHGKGDYTFFSETANSSAMRGFRIQTALGPAVTDGAIDVHFQPQYDIKSRTLVGVETLARWTDAELGRVSPEDFVSIAENVGLIHKLGEHVLRRACSQGKDWTDRLGANIRVAVNVSGRQFSSKGFPAVVRSVLADTGFDPNNLELELTETVFVDDTSRIGPVMQEIAALGIQLSVDDFGTRYASLMYLKRLPVHALKIDQGFVREIHTDAQDKSIVQAICTLGHSLGCRIIAEGVESLEQMKILGSLGCDEIQGYYSGRPAPASHIEGFLTERRWDGRERAAAAHE